TGTRRVSIGVKHRCLVDAVHYSAGLSDISRILASLRYEVKVPNSCFAQHPVAQRLRYLPQLFDQFRVRLYQFFGFMNLSLRKPKVVESLFKVANSRFLLK